MNSLHTWGGVVLGGLLFTIFWMGTLSVFGREIDRWMMPATRLPPSEVRSLESIVERLQPVIGTSTFWTFVFPTEREPVLRVAHRGQEGPFVVRLVNPETGDLLSDAGTLAATNFFRPLHYYLNIGLWDIGYGLVGLATMGMMALCVSGVVIHRKIFADFFTFRRARQPRRLLLDLHNVAGVLGLPFHFMISLSGLILTLAVYFPWQWQPAFERDSTVFARDFFGIVSRPSLGEPSPMTSLDEVIRTAERIWGGPGLYTIRIMNRGDRNALIEVRRTYARDVPLNLDIIYFDGATGAVLMNNRAKPAMSVQRFIGGMHVLLFDHWSLRWIYFVLGLIGCVLIATGYLFWLESRRRRHLQLGLSGVRVVEGLAIGSIAGIIVATLAYLLANRLLPIDATGLGADRAALEVWTFSLVWLATFGHAWLWPGRAWRDQCGTIAGLAVAAVLLNWLTTGDHLARSLAHRHLWSVAGMDLLLLAGAGIAALAAVKLQGRADRRPPYVC